MRRAVHSAMALVGCVLWFSLLLKTIVSVPFTVAVAANADDKGTLTIILGTTNLPAATITEGTMTIK